MISWQHSITPFSPVPWFPNSQLYITFPARALQLELSTQTLAFQPIFFGSNSPLGPKTIVEPNNSNISMYMLGWMQGFGRGALSHLCLQTPVNNYNFQSTTPGKKKNAPPKMIFCFRPQNINAFQGGGRVYHHRFKKIISDIYHYD